MTANGNRVTSNCSSTANSRRHFGRAVAILISVHMATCFGSLFTGHDIASAENPVGQVRVFEMNGTKLYVPLSWGGTSYWPLDGSLQGLRPGEPVPSRFGSPAKLTGMTIRFCIPIAIVGDDPQKPKWQLKRTFVPEEMPSDWCIGSVVLDYGPKNLAAHPRLGVE